MRILCRKPYSRPLNSPLLPKTAPTRHRNSLNVQTRTARPIGGIRSIMRPKQHRILSITVQHPTPTARSHHPYDLHHPSRHARKGNPSRHQTTRYLATSDSESARPDDSQPTATPSLYFRPPHHLTTISSGENTPNAFSTGTFSPSVD